MLVQSNSSSAYFNPYSSPAPFEPKESSNENATQLHNEYLSISQSLTPTEKRLYETLMFSDNYEAAKGIVTVGYLRTSGFYSEGEGNTLSADSLQKDASALLSTNDSAQQKPLLALRDYLQKNPDALVPQSDRPGSLIDFKV